MRALGGGQSDPDANRSHGRGESHRRHSGAPGHAGHEHRYANGQTVQALTRARTQNEWVKASVRPEPAHPIDKSEYNNEDKRRQFTLWASSAMSSDVKPSCDLVAPSDRPSKQA